jgi:hypothetical protein
MSARRRLSIAAAAGAAIALAVPAAASAGTLTISGGVMSYVAAPGEENYLSIYADDDPNVLRVGDSVPIVFGDGAAGVCTGDEFDQTMVCPRPTRFVADLGDGDDGFSVVDLDDVLDLPVEIDGGPGDDNISGGIAADVLRGGPGNDLVIGFDGDDQLFGGDGNDRLGGRRGNDLVDGGEGDDNLIDSLIAEDSYDGADTYIGGPGNDELTYYLRFDPIRVTLDGVGNDGGVGEGDNVGSDIETIGGGQGDDVLVGDDGPQHLYGSGGNDVLIGHGGNDRLDGNDGADSLEGGAGADRLEGGCHDDVLDGGLGQDEILADHGCSDFFKRGANDVLLARDGEPDLVFCSGPGGTIADRAVVDAIDNYTLTGPGACRVVEVPTGSGGGTPGGTSGPAPGGTPGTPGAPGSTAPPVGKTRLTIGPVRLLTGTGRAGQAPVARVELFSKPPRLVLGTLVASAQSKVTAVATMARKGSRRRISIGRATVSLAKGRHATLRLPVSAAARRALKGRKKVAVRITFTVRDARGKTTRKTSTMSVGVAKKAPKR